MSRQLQAELISRTYPVRELDGHAQAGEELHYAVEQLRFTEGGPQRIDAASLGPLLDRFAEIAPSEEVIARIRLAGIRHADPDWLGSALAALVPDEHLLACLRARGSEPALLPLFATWAHEVVLRGRDLPGDVALEALRARLAQRGDSLAAFPFALLPQERSWPRILVEWRDRAFWPRIGDPAAALAKGARLASGFEVSPDVAGPAIGPISPFMDEELLSVTTYRLATPLHASAFGVETLASLGHELLSSGVEAWAIGLDDLLASLFACHVAGAHYVRGLGAGRARHVAWGLAGLVVGCARGALPSDVVERGDEVTLCAVSSDAFPRCGCDLGIACLSPDGRAIKVLIAVSED